VHNDQCIHGDKLSVPSADINAVDVYVLSLSSTAYAVDREQMAQTER